MDILNNRKSDKTAQIAFFDSGIGGLTVLDKVKKILPNENFIYYGDTLHMPYGEKTKEELIQYSDKIFRFFEEKGCKAVVMACNTTSSVVYEEVKNKYNFKLYPIVQSVSEILSKLPIERLGIFATRVTISSNAYQKEIAKYNPNIKVFGQFCPKWVHIVEEHSMDNPQNIEIIKTDLMKMLQNNPEKIVLGCTHYPFLLDVLSKFASKDLFIDPAISFAQYIKDDLEHAGLLNESKTQAIEEFYVSSNPSNFKTSSKMFYEVKDLPKLLPL
jgi:glutamate racemase